ncbi:MAG: cobA, partial [Bacilli bacterium]|nr:cobA [Bacilli bacterium]
AVPAYAGIPVTHRGIASSFIVVTGHEDPTKDESHLNWEAIATTTGTVVVLMGVQNLAWIVDNLLLFGRPADTPVALIRYGTRVEQETLIGTLETIVEQAALVKFRSPAIIVVGEVVNLRQQLSWYERLPLFGKRVLITRARSTSSELASGVQELGGEPYEFPVIETRLPENLEPIQQAIARLTDYDWIVFTSAVGVQFFLQEMRRLQTDLRQLRGRLLAVGPKTAEALSDYGLFAEEAPNEFRAEGIIELYGDKFQAGERVLLPRADLARPLLPDYLRQKGCLVDDLHVYETVQSSENKEEVLDLLQHGYIHAITFTSSSTVHNFAKALDVSELSAVLTGVTVACIGPLTALTAKEYGLQVNVTANSSTTLGLLEGLVDYYIKENQEFNDPN